MVNLKLTKTSNNNNFLDNITDDNEKDVAKLLLNLGFKQIDANSKITDMKGKVIGEIDLILEKEEHIFLIEVTKKARELTEKMDKFFGRWLDKTNTERIYQKYNGDYLKIARIFFSLSEDHPKEEHASRSQWLKPENRCFIIYRDDFSYFQESYQLIGKWAVNDFLSFLGIQNPKQSKEIPAIQFYIGKKRAFCFSVSASDLLRASYIYRRLRNGSVNGYQRALDSHRIKKISSSIISKETIAFPNSILIQGKKFLETPINKSDSPKSVTVDFPTNYCSCRIIDGQHRVLAFAKMSDEIQKSHFLPVIGFDDLSPEEETRVFIDINSTQKRVDRNLLLSLRKDFQWKENTRPYDEATAVKICEKLNENSAMKDKIYFGTAMEKKTGKVKLNTLVSTMLQSNLIGGKYRLYQKSIDDVDESFLRIKEVFSELFKHKLNNVNMEFLLKNQGIRILFSILQIIERNERKEIVSISVSELFGGLAEIMSEDLVNEISSLYGGGGAHRATGRVLKELRKTKNPKFDNLVIDLSRLRIK